MDFNISNKKTLLIFIIALLALLNIAFFFFMRNANIERDTSVREKIEVQAERDNLRIVYDQAKTSIQSLKTNNKKFDKALKERESELKKMKVEIDEILKNKDLSAAELSQAQILIKNLELKGKNFVTEIKQLKLKNKELLSTNIDLKTDLNEEIVKTNELTQEKVILTEEKEELIVETNLLTEIKNKLTTEKENLTEENANLSLLAGLLSPYEIETTGVKVKGNGKEKDKKRAKKSDKLRICYKMRQSETVSDGNKEIYLRVLDNDGMVLSLQEAGSGTFIDYKTKNTMQYTINALIEYDKTANDKFCTFWQNDITLEPGKYKTEIYQSGVLIGDKEFNLK